MATHTLLTGATDVSLAASYDTATAPSGWSAGDILIVPDGTAAVTNHTTAWASIALAYALFGPECSRPIGGNGSNATLDVNNGSAVRALYYYSRGTGFFNVSAGQVVDVRCYGGAVCHLAQGSVTTVKQQEGSITTLGEGFTLSGTFFKQGGTTQIAKHTSGNKIVRMVDAGGTTLCFRTLDTLDLVAPPSSVGIGGFAGGQSSGLFVLDGDAKIDTILNAYGGVYQHRSSGAIDDLFAGAGAYLTSDGAKSNVTVTAALVMKGARIKTATNGVRFNLPAMGSGLETVGDAPGLTV
jgi:hypothetical protein